MKSIFVIGPSGSGKTTLCQALSHLYATIFGSNSVITINLDCANADSDQSDINICELVQLQDIMEEFQIGPNASLLYSIDFLYENIEWLQSKINAKMHQKNPHYSLLKHSKQKSEQQPSQIDYLSNIYVIFDLPGQTELYLNHDSMKKIIASLIKTYTFSPVVIQLFDATYIYEVSHFISMIMMSLVSMVNLEMPHLNLLNKIDVLKGRMPGLGMLNQYCELTSVKEIVNDLNTDHQNKIISELAKLIDNFGQVSFFPCSSYNQTLLGHLIYEIDKIYANNQINAITNPKYKQIVKESAQSFANQKIITNLESQLFHDDEEEDVNAALAEIAKRIKQQK